MKVNSLLYAGNNLDTAKNCWRVLLPLSLSRALLFKVNGVFGHLSPLSGQVEIHKPDRQIGRNDRRPLAFGSLASACIRSFAHSGETMKLRWRSLVRRSFAHPRAVTGTAQALGRFAASLTTHNVARSRHHARNYCGHHGVRFPTHNRGTCRRPALCSARATTRDRQLNADVAHSRRLPPDRRRARNQRTVPNQTGG